MLAFAGPGLLKCFHACKARKLQHTFIDCNKLQINKHPAIKRNQVSETAKQHTHTHKQKKTPSDQRLGLHLQEVFVFDSQALLVTVVSHATRGLSSCRSRNGPSAAAAAARPVDRSVAKQGETVRSDCTVQRMPNGSLQVVWVVYWGPLEWSRYVCIHMYTIIVNCQRPVVFAVQDIACTCLRSRNLSIERLL